MKKLMYSILALIFISSTANANIYDDCEAAVGANELAEVKKLAATIQSFNNISSANRTAANLCVSTALGEEMSFSSGSQSFITKAKLEALQNKGLVLEAAKAQKAKLQKQLSCINAKDAQTRNRIASIDQEFQHINNALILQGTHAACSELYATERSSVMRNQSCLEAFKELGHPDLIDTMNEPKSVYFDELLELKNLEITVRREFNIASDEVLNLNVNKAKITKNNDPLNQERKSCAEFGYEGVYLD